MCRICFTIHPAHSTHTAMKISFYVCESKHNDSPRTGEWKASIRCCTTGSYSQFAYFSECGRGKKKNRNLVVNFPNLPERSSEYNGHWPTISSVLCVVLALATHAISITIDRTFVLHVSSRPAVTLYADTKLDQRMLLLLLLLSLYRIFQRVNFVRNT